MSEQPQSTPPPGGRFTTISSLRRWALKAYRLVAQPRVVRRDRFVVPDEDDVCERPIFIIGLHRSGTTLVRQILDAHPRIACPPETYFLEYLARATDHRDFFVGLDNMGFDRPAAIAGLRRSVRFFYETYRRSKQKPVWADKTPTYVMALDFIEEMFGPECRYLAVVRHPYDVVESLRVKGWTFMKYHEDPFRNLLLYVRDGLERVTELARRFPDRCPVLYYEHLVADPEPQLRATLDAIGEPWDPRVLRFNEHPHDYGTGDPEAQVLKGFRANSGNWGAWTSERRREAAEVLGNVLATHGYGDDPADPAPTTGGRAS